MQPTDQTQTQPQPVPLDPAYLAVLRRIEALPENQPGSDKTWVERAIADWTEHYARAVRVR